MTRNDELKAGQGLSVERVRALLKAGESFAGANELMGHAHVLAEAYLGSEERVEALALERDRLAHELRLLREAVGGELVVSREALQEFLRLAKMGSSYAALKTAAEPIEAALAQSLSSDTPERSGGEG